ncbi:MAG: hypothetical protein MZW92_44955 [Comamonadaceae bacterium]|nr:hypothetical protein [Comamonadaceae bacterium]
MDFAADLKAHGGDPAAGAPRLHGHERGLRQGRGAWRCRSAADQLRPLPRHRAWPSRRWTRCDARRCAPSPQEVRHSAAGRGSQDAGAACCGGCARTPAGWTAAQTTAMHWLQRSDAQERTRAGGCKHGAARGLRPRPAAQRCSEQAAPICSAWTELGQALPARAVQEAGRDDQGALRRGRARHARSPQQRLRRGDERPAPAGQARRARLSNRRATSSPSPTCALSKLRHLPSGLFAPAQASR